MPNVRIIKYENVTDEQINRYLEIMQEDLNVEILDVKLYGNSNDSYMVAYNSDKAVTIKDVLDHIDTH